MKAIIFDSLENAQALCDTLSAKVVYSDGITERYAEPYKHPILDQWAVFITEYVHPYIDVNLLTPLSDDWFQPTEEDHQF